MTEPAQNHPQENLTEVENRQVEQQAMNPAVTNEKGERVDGDGEPGAAKDDNTGNDTHESDK